MGCFRWTGERVRAAAGRKKSITICYFVSCFLQNVDDIVDVCNGGCETVRGAIGEAVELLQQAGDVRLPLRGRHGAQRKVLQLRFEFDSGKRLLYWGLRT